MYTYLCIARRQDWQGIQDWQWSKSISASSCSFGGCNWLCPGSTVPSRSHRVCRIMNGSQQGLPSTCGMFWCIQNVLSLTLISRAVCIYIYIHIWYMHTYVYIMSCYIISYQIVSYHIISYFITLYTTRMDVHWITPNKDATCALPFRRSGAELWRAARLLTLVDLEMPWEMLGGLSRVAKTPKWTDGLSWFPTWILCWSQIESWRCCLLVLSVNILEMVIVKFSQLSHYHAMGHHCLWERGWWIIGTSCGDHNHLANIDR